LTSNPDPHPHLQSYYLVFNERVLHSAKYGELMKRIQILPRKEHVIDAYEIWLSPLLQQEGFSTAAIFPNLSNRLSPDRNDTIVAWRQLFDSGFPFIKSAVLRDYDQAEAARLLLPQRYLSSMDAGSFTQGAAARSGIEPRAPSA
jgi:lipopolysaccharide biosynthesis protein